MGACSVVPPSFSANMSSRAGGLYGGIQFSSTKAFNTASVQPDSSTAVAPVAEVAKPDQPVTTAAVSAAASTSEATSSASTKATAGISSYVKALTMLNPLFTIPSFMLSTGNV